jgi:tyrosyl-DNA phosphodiesterase-1
MPHVKSYTALNEEGQPEWLLVTSANLSNSAWGKLEKDGTQLFCRAYELGVLICAKDHQEAMAKLLPYDLPLTKYGAGDEAFVWDKVYKESDAWGLRCVMGE